MSESQIKLETIKTYLEELLITLPVELGEQVRALHKLIISLQSHLELSEMHQRQAVGDMARLGEMLGILRLHSFRISDVSQKLQLLSTLIKELNITVIETTTADQAAETLSELGQERGEAK